MNIGPYFCFLTGLALAGSARAQDEIKAPRPIPLSRDDKGASSLDSSPLPTTPLRRMAGISRANSDSSGSPAATSLPITVEHVLFSEPGDGHVWARGADYKVSFGSENVMFIPFLGSDAPRNFPITFTLVSVQNEGHPVAFAKAGSVSRIGERVVIERGDIDEVYDLRLHDMEQTIVVERLPSLGALHIELAIESELDAHPIGAGIEFANDWGGVRYGSVIVTDADGARFETASTLIDGHITIDIPAAFVATARFPLRVDPVLTTFTVATPAVDESSSDVSFDLTNNVWCSVREHAYSASDHDIYTVLFDGQGAIVAGSEAYIDLTIDYWTQPRIANNNIADNFLVTGTVYPFNGGATIIKAATRAAGSSAIGTQNLISGNESGAKLAADVGGDPNMSGPTYYLVVYERDYSSTDTDIHARLVNSNGTPQGATIFIENSVSNFDIVPRVSNSNGAPPSATQEWNVVWNRHLTPSSPYDVLGAQVHWDGIISTPTFTVEGLSSDDTRPVASSPLDRASGPRPWFVVYEHSVGTHTELFGRVFANSTLLAAANLSLIDDINFGEDVNGPDVDSDGLVFTVAFYESILGSPFYYDIYASTFAYADGQVVVSEGHAALDNLSEYSYLPKIAAAHSSGQSSSDFGATWTNQGATFYVLAGLYTTPYDVPDISYCSGDGSTFNCPCGNNGSSGNGCGHSADAGGAALVAGGTHHVTNDTAFLSALNLPPGAPCLYFQGTAPTAVPFGDGYLCVGGTIVRLGVAFSTSGVATYPGSGDPAISIKGLLGVNGGSRYYQAWYRDSSAFCTASTFNTTNGVQTIWLP